MDSKVIKASIPVEAIQIIESLYNACVDLHQKDICPENCDVCELIEKTQYKMGWDAN